MAEKKATREAYGDTLVALGAEYKNLVVLDADLAEATKTCKFKAAYPERFFDCGIAEGNMMGVAAGLASAGCIPFASSFAMFASGRAFEQVRNMVGYPHLNVKIGATHQCNEDIALMRTIPGMTIINPADCIETAAAVKAAIDFKGPVYMRFGRYAVPNVYGEDYKFELGKGVELRDGKDVTIVATGLTVHMALEAADMLAEDNISARVINIHTIKPIDEEILVKAARETGAVVTAEEHTVIGGLGSAVAEVLTEKHPVPMRRIGVNDKFGKSGQVPELLEEYGLTAKNIAAKAKEAIAMKK